jgi:hypothetical protein
VYYENLVQFPEKEIKDICSYLGVTYQDEMLDTSVENEMSNIVSNETISSWRSKESYNKAISKENINKWQTTLNKSEINLIELFLSKRKFLVLERYNLECSQFSTKCRLKLLTIHRNLHHKFPMLFQEIKYSSI